MSELMRPLVILLSGQGQGRRMYHTVIGTYYILVIVEPQAYLSGMLFVKWKLGVSTMVLSLA